MTSEEILLIEVIKLRAETSALSHLMGVLASRSARDFEDPEQYIMTWLAPLEEYAAEISTDTPEGDAALRATVELRDKIEHLALSLLRD